MFDAGRQRAAHAFADEQQRLAALAQGAEIDARLFADPMIVRSLRIRSCSSGGWPW